MSQREVCAAHVIVEARRKLRFQFFFVQKHRFTPYVAAYAVDRDVSKP